MGVEFDREAAGAQAMAMMQQGQPEADASTETEESSAEETADDSTADGGEEEDSEESEPEDGSEDSKEGGDTGGVDIEAAKEAAIAGDTAALAKALGIEERAVDTSNRKLKFVRKSLKEARELKSSTEKIQTDLREVYGDVHSAQEMLKSGDWQGAVECYEKTFGSFEDLVTKVLGARQAEDNSELSQRERRIKEREAAFEESKRKLEESSRASAEEAAAVSRVKTALKGHGYVKDADDAREVVKRVIASAGPDGKPTLTAKAAADKLLAEARKKAEKLGIAPRKAKPRAPSKTPVKLSKAATPARKMKLKETRADIFPEDERRRIIAEAKRLSGVK